MPLTLNISPPSLTQTVSASLPKTMNIIPSSRLGVTTSSTTRNDDSMREALEERHSKVPVVKLDVDTISDMIASSLASSLLAHVLFLKNQIPLPVMQLAKLSNTKRNNNATDIRATKQRTELLATYDTLASHLNTTFTSLSTAFARCKRLDASSQASTQPSEQDKADEEDESNVSRRKTVRAYITILVGPSIGSARSKVLLGVDGLEARIWGEREDVPRVGTNEREVDDSEEDEVGESENEESEEEDAEESGDNEENSEQEEEEFDEPEHLESSDEDEHVFDEDEATPPPSSPSLVSNSSSPSPSPSPHVSPKLSPSSMPPLKSSATHSQLLTPPKQATSPPYISHAQQQQTLLNAERLLSRTLALADADGYCLASDMTPTQTHILIRAPRRFSHPAWIPRQNITASMEKVLEEFLAESGITLSSTLPADRSRQNKGNGKKAGQKNIKKVEGVWIVGRRSRIGKGDTDDTDWEAKVEDGEKGPDDEKHENDDMIWWSWDGKLVGFSDW